MKPVKIVVGIFKVLKCVVLKVRTDIFSITERPCSLRHQSKFKSEKIKIFRYGIEKAINRPKVMD